MMKLTLLALLSFPFCQPALGASLGDKVVMRSQVDHGYVQILVLKEMEITSHNKSNDSIAIQLSFRPFIGQPTVVSSIAQMQIIRKGEAEVKEIFQNCESEKIKGKIETLQVASKMISACKIFIANHGDQWISPQVPFGVVKSDVIIEDGSHEVTELVMFRYGKNEY